MSQVIVWLFRVEGDEKNQYLDAARLAANSGKDNRITQDSFNYRSG